MGGPTPAKGASDGEDDIPATTARRTTARKSLAPTAAPRSALKKQPSVAALREQEEEGGQGLEGTAPSSEAEKGRGKVSKVDDAVSRSRAPVLSQHVKLTQVYGPFLVGCAALRT